MTHRLVLAIALGASLFIACGKKEEATKAGPGSGPVAAGDPAGKKAAAKELADSAEPAAITWKRIDQPFGSLELPAGAGWEIVENQLQGDDGTVIMMQSQDGIEPDVMDEYLASYDDVQKRDAPKYAGKGTTRGAVNGAVAARVEGTFDNGTAFVTRDYLVFAKGKVVMIGSRTPTSNAAALPGIVDHAARSLQVK